MAQRYGGKFSPEQNRRESSSRQKTAQFPRGAKRTRAGGRVNFLFLTSAPLAIRAFTSPPAQMAMLLVAFGTLILSAWLTREGLLAQEAYEARKVARRPALPRKIIGAVLMGAGLGLAGFATTGGNPVCIAFGLAGLALHLFSFGLDPLKDKGMDGRHIAQTDRVARAVEQAETHLRAMSDALRLVADRPLLARVERFQSTARDMFRVVEDDPRDLTAARKYLGIYLIAARDATQKFADIETRAPSQESRQKYEALLDDLESGFSEKTRLLLLDDHADLDVEIEVLRERLERDGLISGQ